MQLTTLKNLFIYELRDLYSAENQLVRALPKVAKAAGNELLRTAVEEHLEQTKGHVSRLEQIFELIETSSRGPACKAMEGLIEESSGMLEEKGDPEVIDAGIICGAQRIEHYEIAAYGCARTFAELLGEQEAMELLQLTLDEEKAADKKLTELAVSVINLEAAEV